MKQFFIFFSLLIFSRLTFGQNKPLPFLISLFNESTSIPYTGLFTTPVHPGIQVGTEFNYKVRKHSRWFQSVNSSYFYHKYLAQGISIKSDLGLELKNNSGLSFSSMIGIGYMQSLSTAEEFHFIDDQYVQKTDFGNARFIPSLSVDMGYYFNVDNMYSPKLFIRYETWIEYPYSPGFIPLMTHVNLHVGTRFYVGQKNKEQ